MSSNCTRSHWDYRLVAWCQPRGTRGSRSYGIYRVPEHHLCVLRTGITCVWTFISSRPAPGAFVVVGIVVVGVEKMVKKSYEARHAYLWSYINRVLRYECTGVCPFFHIFIPGTKCFRCCICGEKYQVISWLLIDHSGWYFALNSLQRTLLLLKGFEWGAWQTPSSGQTPNCVKLLRWGFFHLFCVPTLFSLNTKKKRTPPPTYIIYLLRHALGA